MSTEGGAGGTDFGADSSSIAGSTGERRAGGAHRRDPVANPADLLAGPADPSVVTAAPAAGRAASTTAPADPITAGTDPRVPPLRPPAHQVDPRAVRWWQLRAVPAIVVLLAAGVVGAVLTGWALLWVAVAVVIVAGVAYEVVVPRLLFRLHRWEVTDEAVYTLSGWIVREWRIAPISRVQTVDTEHGPLQQVLKLATVTVTTASARGPVKIAGLADGDARELARTLTETTQAHPGDAT